MATRRRSILVWFALSVTAFATGMAGLLLFVQHQRDAATLNRDLLFGMGNHVVAIVERHAVYAQDIYGLTDMPDVLKRLAQTNASIERMDVFTQSGLRLYTSHPGSGELSGAEFQRVRQSRFDTVAGAWPGGGASFLAMRINNSFGVAIGWLVFKVSEKRSASTELLWRLAIVGTSVTLVFSTLLYALLFLRWRRLEALFSDLHRMLYLRELQVSRAPHPLRAIAAGIQERAERAEEGLTQSEALLKMIEMSDERDRPRKFK